MHMPDLWDVAFSWLLLLWHVSNISLSNNTNKKKVVQLALSWSTTLWCIWMECNDVLFKGKVANILEEVVECIKYLPGSWFICEEGRNKNLFSWIGGWTQLYVFKACNFLTYYIEFRASLILVLVKFCL